MAGSVNKVILVGNVGKEPEIRSTQHGSEIATFSLATSEVWRDKATGERREKTEWHRVVIFANPLVNLIKNYVHKGSKLYIEGALQTRKWSDNNGVERNTTEVVLQAYVGTIVLLDGKPGNAGHGGESYGGGHNDGHNQDNPPYAAEDLNDEIPF